MTASTRRAALGAILAAPLMPAPVVAVPSDLARVCEWAADHWQSMDRRGKEEDWSDARHDVEIARYDAVWDRAMAEPSRTLAEVKAKARLCLGDFLDHAQPWIKAEDNQPLDPLEKMVVLVLREVIAI